MPDFWRHSGYHLLDRGTDSRLAVSDAFCRMLDAWVAHLLQVDISIQPIQKIADQRWVWHAVFDIESSQILNHLYNGVEVDQDRIGQILSLFRLEFNDPSVMRPDIAGRAVYLAVAMDKRSELRLKPQNLPVNLPLAARA